MVSPAHTGQSSFFVVDKIAQVPLMLMSSYAKVALSMQTRF